MSRFMNTRFSAMTPYTPGEQPKDTKYIKLNTNESPYPPGSATIKAIKTAEENRSLRLYPDPDQRRLKEVIAERFEVDAENVFCSNGSDDILNFAFLAFGERGVCFPEITYGFYPVFCDLHGLSFETIPLKEDFTIDPSNYFDKKGKLIVIANPNAPTGLFLGKDAVRSMAERNRDSVIIIDEAYIDFGGQSMIPLIKEYDNIMIVQTFSKSRSLAGARLGYAIGPSLLMADLEQIKYSTNPYNINSVSLAAGIAAIGEDGYYKENCRRIMETRAFVTEELKAMGFQVCPSVANFIFIRHDRIGGEALYKKLKDAKILIRHFDNPLIVEYNRVTIGKDEEMQAFLAAVRDILAVCA